MRGEGGRKETDNKRQRDHQPAWQGVVKGMTREDDHRKSSVRCQSVRSKLLSLPLGPRSKIYPDRRRSISPSVAAALMDAGREGPVLGMYTMYGVHGT